MGQLDIYQFGNKELMALLKEKIDQFNQNVTYHRILPGTLFLREDKNVDFMVGGYKDEETRISGFPPSLLIRIENVAPGTLEYLYSIVKQHPDFLDAEDC